jgi:hypothetical protein
MEPSCAEPKMFLLHSSSTFVPFALVAVQQEKLQAIHQSLYAFLQPYNIEVYEEAETLSTEFEIGEHLRLMNW